MNVFILVFHQFQLNAALLCSLSLFLHLQTIFVSYSLNLLNQLLATNGKYFSLLTFTFSSFRHTCIILWFNPNLSLFVVSESRRSRWQMTQPGGNELWLPSLCLSHTDGSLRWPCVKRSEGKERDQAHVHWATADSRLKFINIIRGEITGVSCIYC